MMRLILLFLGALAAVVFASFILLVLPQISLPNAPANIPLTPYLPEESPLKPYSDSEAKGRQIYIANGCYYCHSQQVRDPVFTNDMDRGWGGRPSYPSDYLYDSPALLGTQRTGPDLINVGSRLPDRNWHLVHLYQPRALVPWSIMPSFEFLFELKDSPGPHDQTLKVPEAFAPQRKVIVVTEEATDLVNYLLSLKRDFPPPELKVESEKLKQQQKEDK